MPGPLGDATRQRLTETAASRLAARGFTLARPATRAEPPAIAERDGETLSVEPLTADDATPTTIVSRLGHALDRDRRALFVVESADVAGAVRSFLTDPPLLVSKTDGRRTFHSGPDRVPVNTSGLANATGGYACVRISKAAIYDAVESRRSKQTADTGSLPALPSAPGSAPDATIQWRETDTPLGPVPAVDGIDTDALSDEDRPAVPRLVCEVRGRVVAVLGGVQSLQTPPASAFPYFYRRDPTDKRFRVRRGADGAVIESLSGFSQLRDAGFRPIPMPLVPEHVIRTGGDVDDAWDLLTV